MTKYRVHLGGTRYRFFESLADASTFCSEHAARTNVILSIEAVTLDPYIGSLDEELYNEVARS